MSKNVFFMDKHGWTRWTKHLLSFIHNVADGLREQICNVRLKLISVDEKVDEVQQTVSSINSISPEQYEAIAKKTDLPTDYSSRRDLLALYYKTHVDSAVSMIPNVISTASESSDLIGSVSIGGVSYYEFYCPRMSDYRFFVKNGEVAVGNKVYCMYGNMTEPAEWLNIAAVKTERIALKEDIPSIPTDYAKAGTNAKTLDDISIDTSTLAKSSELDTFDTDGTKISVATGIQYLLSRLGKATNGWNLLQIIEDFRDFIKRTFMQGSELKTELGKLAKPSDIPAVPTDYAKSSEVTEAKNETIAVRDKMGTPDDDKTKTTIFGRIANIADMLTLADGEVTNELNSLES